MRNYKIWILVLIGFFVYGNILFNSFLLDDEVQILRDTAVHSLINFPTYFLGSTFNNGGTAIGLYYKPLMTTGFALIYSIFGAQAWAFHFVQIILHITTGILVYLILKKLLKHDLLAWFLAAVFLVHPINSEAVAYIADYQDVLFLLFGLLSLFADSPYISALLLFASLLCKETGIVMAAIVTLYYVLYKRNKLKVFLASLTGILLLYVFLRFGVAHLPIGKSKLTPIAVLPLSGRLMNAPAIMFYYLKTFIWPDNLAINQLWIVKKITWMTFTFPLLADTVFCSLLGWFLFVLKRTQSKLLTPYLFFLFWILVGIGFHLQLFPLDVTVSARWFYLPMIGLLGMIGCTWLFLSSRLTINHSVKKFLIGVIIIVLVSLSIRTFMRTFDWRNGLTLTKHDLALSPDNFLLENNYGVELFRIGELDEASIHYRRSIELQSRWWENYNNLGIYYLLKGNLSAAESSYIKSITNGEYYDAYANLSLLYLKEKRYVESLNYLEETLRLFPQSQQNSKILYALAIDYYQTGQKEQALIVASSLLKIDSSSLNQELYQFIKTNK